MGERCYILRSADPICRIGRVAEGARASGESLSWLPGYQPNHRSVSDPQGCPAAASSRLMACGHRGQPVP